MSEPVDASIMNIVPMSPRSARPPDESFAELFAAAYPQLVRTVWFVTHDRATAEEVVQDAFIELFRGWSRLRDFDRPDLWVRRVAIRKAQREAARGNRRLFLEQRTATGPLEEGPVAPDPQLLAAIRTLPPRQRAIVVLFYLEDRPMAEVAELVGCTTSTGFVHLHHARKRLATLLGEEVGDDVR